MEIITLVVFVSSLGILVLGAELLVKGASRLALLLKITPVVVGLTVVAYGTSAPELAVNLQSVLTQQSNLAIGNIVGSNISNILLILGITALITPLVVSKQLVQVDVPFMIVVFLLFYGFATDGLINFIESTFFVILMLSYSVFSITQSGVSADNQNLTVTPQFRAWLQPIWILSGLFLLVVGANGLVDSAVTIAKSLGISELIIGLTIVAIGTSAPELATSVVAGLRGQRDIAVGNVIGSNIFNVLLVLGVTGLLAPNGIPVPESVLTMDIFVMLAAGIICFPIFISGYVIRRWEGLIFLSYYGMYIAYLVLQATQHPQLAFFSQVMLIVVPVTLILLIIFAWYDTNKRT